MKVDNGFGSSIDPGRPFGVPHLGVGRSVQIRSPSGRGHGTEVLRPRNPIRCGSHSVLRCRRDHQHQDPRHRGDDFRSPDGHRNHPDAHLLAILAGTAATIIATVERTLRCVNRRQETRGGKEKGSLGDYLRRSTATAAPRAPTRANMPTLGVPFSACSSSPCRASYGSAAAWMGSPPLRGSKS